jgi:hypothetical protein
LICFFFGTNILVFLVGEKTAATTGLLSDDKLFIDEFVNKALPSLIVIPTQTYDFFFVSLL